MCKIETSGIFGACLFGVSGFLENGAIAVTVVMCFAIFTIILFTKKEADKKRRFMQTKKALIRKRARA